MTGNIFHDFFFVGISLFLNTFRKKLSNRKAIKSACKMKQKTVNFKRQGFLAKGSIYLINISFVKGQFSPSNLNPL